MTDYGNLIENKTDKSDFYDLTLKKFLDDYKPSQPVDLYQWLWEGEYGLTKEKKSIPVNLKLLNKEISHTSQEFSQKKPKKVKGQDPIGAKEIPVCEPLGLAESFIRVNLMAYIRDGCPLLRLLELQKLVPCIRSNRHRFKQHWQFAKENTIKIETENNYISNTAFEEFEKRTVLYTYPELSFSKNFLKRYSPYYQIVPQIEFFKYFPEYKILV